MRKVVVTPLLHRGMECISIRFEKDWELISITKRLPAVRFSKTHSCWYAPVETVKVSDILDAFKGKAWVDYSTFKTANHFHEPDRKDENDATHLLNFAQNSALKAVEETLDIKGYSVSTKNTYLGQFRSFLLFYKDINPTDIGEIEISDYMLHLVRKRQLSRSAQNQAINAIKFYFEKVLRQDRKMYSLERPLRERKLPQVLSQEELLSIFDQTNNVKHKVMLMLIYAAGLRRSELLNLRLGDVDIHRGIVFVDGGKGRKDRQSILARYLIPLLQAYIAGYKPKRCSAFAK